jgi:hypothetical protein
MSFAAFAESPDGPGDSSAGVLTLGVVRAPAAPIGSAIASDGLEAGVARFPIAPAGAPGAVVPGLLSRLTSAFDGPDPSIRLATLAACFEANAAAADAFAASLEAMAAFSDAARACFTFFLLARPGVSPATGDAAGVGVSVGAVSMVGLGVGDAPPKTFVNQLVPDVPPAHPARKISESERT